MEDKANEVPKEEKGMDGLLKSLTFLLPFVFNLILNALLSKLTDMQYPAILGFPLTILVIIIIYFNLKRNGYSKMAKDYRKWIFISYLTCVGLLLLEMFLTSLRG